MQRKNKILVSVFGIEYQLIENAEVKITSKKHSEVLKFDKYEGAYVSLKFAADRYNISVAARNLETQERSVFVGESGISETFILGEKGLPFYYRERVKVPFIPINDSFGIVIQSNFQEGEKMISAYEAKYGIKRIESHKNYRKNGLFVFKYPSNLNEEEKQNLRNTIQKQKEILTVSPLLKQSEKNASLLTDEIIVRFKGNIEKKEVERIARDLGLKIMRSIPYAGNAYQFKILKGNGYEILDVCTKLVEMGVVEYAEPNLFHTFENDAITPNNYLFPEQWDHPIINTPDAWQVLNDNLGANQRFGNPDIVVAVVDTGVNVAHQQFSGNVSNGQPKVLTAFNFISMVANNNSLSGSHGSCCASASVGYTNTSSVAGGLPDGTVGIAGNCRLMAIERGGVEADYADMYIWIAGFNPNSSRAGFPTLLAKGADVISSSFGQGFTAPIAGVMKDAFDYLTTYGRNGKGVIMTFSVGNYWDNINFHMRRPWAAYEKTLACGASSLDDDGITEEISTYSGSGTLLDFCAPSHDEYGADDLPVHNPPSNYAAWSGTVLHDVSEDDGNVPRNREVQTTLSANVLAGASSISVVSTAGMSAGQAIMIGPPHLNISTSEAKRITNIAGNTITFTPNTFRSHNIGTTVSCGSRDYKNGFGGTSYSTPVCAGIAALMLSVKPSLTWIEVREIMRETAVKIDPNNIDPVGRWKDTADRISTDPGYTGPFFSQFYGYGRVSASAAVTTANGYPSTRDIYVRDNMADLGATTSVSPHWHGVEIWVRNNNDGIAPANYNTDANTVHQNPIAGQSNWLNIRYKNRGTVTSYPFYVRAYIAHFPGTEFIYPDNFTPTVRPDGVIPSPLTPGTYLIGEQLVNPITAGNNGYVTMEWEPNLIPPQTIDVDGITVHWHPCMLIEVSPHDGFLPTGNHVWDDNNLAQKNLTVVYPDSSPGDNSVALIVGNATKGKFKNLKFVITFTQKIKQPYFIYFPNSKINEPFISYSREKLRGSKVDRYNNRPVVWFNTPAKLSFQIPNIGLTPVIIGIGKGQKIKKGFEMKILQYSGRKISGSFGIEFRKG